MGLKRLKALDLPSRRQRIPFLNLNSPRCRGSPVVAVIEAAQPCLRNHSGGGGGFHSRPTEGSLLAQPKMRSVFVVVGNVLIEQPFQVKLVEGNDVVQHVGATAFDPALGHAVLPGTLERRTDAGDIHRSCGKRDLKPVFCIPVKNEIFRCRLIWECFAQLLNDPSARRMPCHVEVQDLATVVAQDEKTIEQIESHRRDGEEVHRGDGFPVIPQECHPSLGWFGISGDASHLPGNGSL